MSNVMNAVSWDMAGNHQPGNFPFRPLLLLSVSTTATAVGTAGPILDVVGDILVDLAGLTSETVQIQGSNNNGATWSAALNPLGATTENLQANAATLGNGRYILPVEKFGHFTSFRLVKSAAVETLRAQVIAIVPKMRARGIGNAIPG